MDLQTWLLHSYYLHAGTTSDKTYSGKTHREFPKRLMIWGFFWFPKQESTDYLDRGTTTNFSRKGPSTIAKIKEALNFMRNQQFEVENAH